MKMDTIQESTVRFLLTFSLIAVSVAIDVVPVLRSCAELKLAGYSIEGEYRIDPDGPGKDLPPFTVYCEMNDGLTVVEHDQMLHANVPQGFELPGEFRIPVTYQGGVVTIEQLARIADISSHCSQYISVDCHDSAMWERGGDRPIGFWVSRDGTTMTNWGTPTGTRGCQCSLTSSCASTNRQTCNCDANDHEWRKDDGDLTDKTTLPVTELRFGDTGSEKERVVYKVGALKCSGIDDELFPSCNAWSDAGYTEEGDYLIHLPGETASVQRCNEQTDLPSPPPILRSCEELKLAGYTANDDYLIDPDMPSFGLQPFPVYCDMSAGTSILTHDRHGPLLSVGFEDAGSHRIIVHYRGASLQQIARLADISHTCRQYMSRECHGSITWSSDSTMYTWWMSRDGTNMTNWGSPTGTQGCGCHLTQYCCDPDRRCNCDSNDYVWRRDDGYITDKSTLPVWQLRIGDTGAAKEVSLTTLGELKCQGIGAELHVSCDSLRDLGFSGEGHYLIDPDGSKGQQLPRVVRCNGKMKETPSASPVVDCLNVSQPVTDSAIVISTDFKPDTLATSTSLEGSQYNDASTGTTGATDTSNDATTGQEEQLESSRDGNNTRGQSSKYSDNEEGRVEGNSRRLSSSDQMNISKYAFNFLVVGVFLVLIIVTVILIVIALQWKKNRTLKSSPSAIISRTTSPRSSVGGVFKGEHESPDLSDSFSNVRFVNLTSSNGDSVI